VLVGLQGSGKTTAAAKLPKKLRSSGERVMLVAADIYRPAAIKQLQTLGERIDVPVFTVPGAKPVQIAREAKQSARNGGYSVLILDTAGRSSWITSDDVLVGSTRQCQPTRYCGSRLDDWSGSAQYCKGFHKEIPFTGLVFTKIDGDARGGAAISIREVTGIPIKYLGTGRDWMPWKSLTQLEFRIASWDGRHPWLIEKAKLPIVAKLIPRSRKNAYRSIHIEDFAKQLRQMKKMGPISQLFGMLPGQLSAVANRWTRTKPKVSLRLSKRSSIP
jgi:signal recognition particle subunit SRP54